MQRPQACGTEPPAAGRAHTPSPPLISPHTQKHTPLPRHSHSRSAEVITYSEWRDLYYVQTDKGAYIKNTVENYPESVTVSEVRDWRERERLEGEREGWEHTARAATHLPLFFLSFFFPHSPTHTHTPPKINPFTLQAIGYGMIAAALTDHKYDFDQFLKFYKNFGNAKSGMMAWQIISEGGSLKPNPNPSAHADDSGTDGDMDAAAALVVAHDKWGDAAYLTEAKRISNALMKFTVNPVSKLPNLGDWVTKDPSEFQDRGAPGVGPRQYHYVTRASDCMAWNMELLSKVDPKWKQVQQACLRALKEMTADSGCGLPPDFAIYDPATKKTAPVPSDKPLLEKMGDADFSWNACRAPWRLAAYIKRNPQDALARQAAGPMTSFFEERAFSKLYAGYYLPSCTPRVDYINAAFSGPAWALLKVMGKNDAAAAMEDQIRTARAVPKWGKSYYSDSILLLSQLETR
jgi:endoglucanase